MRTDSRVSPLELTDDERNTLNIVFRNDAGRGFCNE